MWTKSPGYVYGGEVRCVEGRRYVGVKIEVRGNPDIVKPLMWTHYWDVCDSEVRGCIVLIPSLVPRLLPEATHSQTFARLLQYGIYSEFHTASSKHLGNGNEAGY